MKGQDALEACHHLAIWPRIFLTCNKKQINISQSMFQKTQGLQDTNRCYIRCSNKLESRNKTVFLLQNFSVFDKIKNNVSLQDVYSKKHSPPNYRALEHFSFYLKNQHSQNISFETFQQISKFRSMNLWNLETRYWLIILFKINWLIPFILSR